jgi:Flp pilus assembly protein TadG
MTRPFRRRVDRGSVAVVELPLGLLLLVPAALLVLTVATWFERSAAARTAADEAARTVVLPDSWDQGAADAQAVVDEIAANYDLDPGDLTLQLEGDLTRGGTVTAHVTVRIPAAAIPLLGGIGGFDRTVSHTEQVDQYRTFPTGS